MYARRLRLMESLERKLAPLEKYHLDVVGLAEDTRGEIAFLRGKLGPPVTVDNSSSFDTELAAQAKRMEEGSVGSGEDEVGGGHHEPGEAESRIHQDNNRDVDVELEGSGVRDERVDAQLSTSSHRIRSPTNRFLPSLFPRQSLRRGKDVTPARLQRLRRVNNTVTTDSSKLTASSTRGLEPMKVLSPRPSRTSSPLARKPRRRLSKRIGGRGKQHSHQTPGRVGDRDGTTDRDPHLATTQYPAGSEDSGTLAVMGGVGGEDRIAGEHWRDIGPERNQVEDGRKGSGERDGGKAKGGRERKDEEGSSDRGSIESDITYNEGTEKGRRRRERLVERWERERRG
ncbi:MAG: hypothetical protein Q9170_007762 [Blastenia crenularia]